MNAETTNAFRAAFEAAGYGGMIDDLLKRIKDRPPTWGPDLYRRTAEIRAAYLAGRVAGPTALTSMQDARRAYGLPA